MGVFKITVIDGDEKTNQKIAEVVLTVYDAAMAARRGGAFYAAIYLLREHGLDEAAAFFVPLELACLRAEEVEHGYGR